MLLRPFFFFFFFYMVSLNLSKVWHFSTIIVVVVIETNKVKKKTLFNKTRYFNIYIFNFN